MRFPRNEIISLIGEAPRHELGESVGPDLTLRDVLDEEAVEALRSMPLGYGTAPGEARLRAAVAARHGVHADEVVITVGGIHALFLLGFGLCNAGDEAVAATPLFPPARDVLRAVGAELRSLSLAFDNGYQPSLAAFEACLSARTRLVSVASPQNPSGVAIAPATLARMLAAMARHCPEAVLIVDETYREATYGDRPAAGTAVHLDPRVVSVASLSKCHGAPGLRIGWAITRNAALRETLILGKFNTVISCSPLDEALALRVLERQETVLGDRRTRLAEGLALTARWVARERDRVQWVPPDAGALCCVRLHADRYGDDAAVRAFYEACRRQGVRVAPGSWFGEEDRVFRLGFGYLPADRLGAALDALSAALNAAPAGR